MDFIQNGSGKFTGEGFASHCKWDNKQYSHGHGTRCYTPGAKVTQEQADLEFKTHLNPLYKLVDKSCYNDNQKIAIVSYMYNTGGYQMNLRKYITTCLHKDIKHVMSVWGWDITPDKRYPGLNHRRSEELKLFNL